MNTVTRKQIANGVYFNAVDDTRFKTGRISVTMFVPLLEDVASANALLPQVLTRSCEKYPDFISLNSHLNALYGASVAAFCRKMGETQALTISAAGLDDRFTMGGESVSVELTALLCEMLFRPKLENGAFCREDVEQERRQMVDMIDAEYNDKRTYALGRCIEVMCANETFGIKRYGTKQQVQALSAKDVYSAWERVLQTARVEIMAIGSFDKQAACTVFEKAFAGVDRAPVQMQTQIIRTVKEVKTETEKMDVAQSKLVMAFRSGIAEPDLDVMAARMMCAVLGGTPHSKFFLNVREKYSLCYYCAARFDRNKGIITVESGVENENIEKARKEIENQICLLQNGELSDFEMQATKMSVANSFQTMADSVSGTEAWYISQMLDRQVLTPQQAAEKINAVTRQQVIDAAKKMTLDTVYILTGGKD
ncbi:MAG: insulinase family protein [Acutalibacteraceae bacterium]|nr:insulinase family protein [Acutalibacteraceae bacterium]